jgi:hypothetical protein
MNLSSKSICIWIDPFRQRLIPVIQPGHKRAPSLIRNLLLMGYVKEQRYAENKDTQQSHENLEKTSVALFLVLGNYLIADFLPFRIGHLTPSTIITVMTDAVAKMEVPQMTALL